MTEVLEIDDLKIGLVDETDEYIILYESTDKTERIVLFRSMIRQIEYVLLSPSLIHTAENIRLTKSYLELNEYHLLLNHRNKIQLYQFKDNRIALFHAFFRMTTTAFFNSIAVHS
ncbi:hypothetical protein [Flavobacterium sp. W21_SRS_FM6]|uniref:hypothetical protein n=1 Tax=Flavobacterium sp. W21_SRS_FM6 TaxID=3240268 RepID=UPI003F934B43